MDNWTIAEPSISAADPVTNDLRNVIQLINYVIACGVISLFGIGANLINISVFVRQGFKDSINISLLGLSVADLMSSFTMFCIASFYSLHLQHLDLPFAPLDVMYITAGWIHWWFNRISSFITAFITLERCLCIAMPLKVKTLITAFITLERCLCIAMPLKVKTLITAFITLERCLCIAMPLKVKNIITPFRTKVIIVFIFSATSTLFVPCYFVHKLEWKFNSPRNRSLLILTFSPDRTLIESVTSFVHSVLLSSVLLLSVVVCTIILIVKLNQKTKWRKTSVAQTASTQEAISVKEKKVVKMITLISSIFLVCFIPPTMIFLVMVFTPELSVGGRYENTLFVVWSGPFVLDAVNSSVNIFVYFNMSTKYKVTFLELLCVFPQAPSTSVGVKQRQQLVVSRL